MEIFLLILCGAVGGLLGAMGFGGGTALIPLLVCFLSVPQKLAQAINIFSFFLVAVIAIIIHTKNKLIKLKPIWLVLIMMPITSFAASLLAKKIDSKILAICFGVFLILLGLFMLFKRNK